MKKTVLVLLSFLMLVFIGCSGKYSDAVEVNEEFLDVMIDYLEGLDKADSAGKVAASMNKFADRMAVLGPKMKKISEKYPELKDENSQPEEFKELRKKGDAMEKKFAGSFMKTMKYMNDPEVQKAQQRLSAAMQTMAK
ncbi:MAG: hypothetical protein HF978_18770 [Desulfobacteraceae bacterium]|nr:hypothetical protein [Desulfobacteraceae bacterium]MBC2757591.1 hypothetical protein [Desulfobacteraceae bacterium]